MLELILELVLICPLTPTPNFTWFLILNNRLAHMIMLLGETQPVHLGWSIVAMVKLLKPQWQHFFFPIPFFVFN